jgi:hypothetical protein
MQALETVMKRNRWRLAFALTWIAGAVASPARGVSAAPSEAGPSETLVYHSSWQTGKFDIGPTSTGVSGVNNWPSSKSIDSIWLRSREEADG